MQRGLGGIIEGGESGYQVTTSPQDGTILQVSEGSHLVPHLTEFARAPDAAAVFEPLEHRCLMFPNLRVGFVGMPGDVFRAGAPLIALWAVIGKPMSADFFC